MQKVLAETLKIGHHSFCTLSAHEMAEFLHHPAFFYGCLLLYFPSARKGDLSRIRVRMIMSARL
jgi:hypothetical protein